MITFSVSGFVAEGESYVDFILDILAESPVEAVEQALQKRINLVVSNVCRSGSGCFFDY